MKIIIDYNRTLFDPETRDLYPGAFTLLEQLAVRHDLYLVSKNEPGRSTRLEQLGISRFFKQTYFVEEKTPDLFVSILENAQGFVIGDKLNSEIAAGNAANCVTIRVCQGKYALELAQNSGQQPTHTVLSLVEVPEIVKRYEQ